MGVRDGSDSGAGTAVVPRPARRGSLWVGIDRAMEGENAPRRETRVTFVRGSWANREATMRCRRSSVAPLSMGVGRKTNSATPIPVSSIKPPKQRIDFPPHGPKQIRPVFETGTQGWSDRGYADGIDEQRSVGAVAVFLQAQATWSRQRRSRFADRAADVRARVSAQPIYALLKSCTRGSDRRTCSSLLIAADLPGFAMSGGYRVMLISNMRSSLSGLASMQVLGVN